MSLFNYNLQPVQKCRFPISENGHKNIAWFWLTDSHYYIQLGDVKLFESSKEWQEKYPADSPYDEYPYIRQLEDLFQILPHIAAGIPQTAYQYIYTLGNWEWIIKQTEQWYDLLDNHATEKQENTYNDLIRFLYHGYLDTGYLRFKSQVFFYHIDDQLIIHYDFTDKDEDDTPVWSAKQGKFQIKWTTFLTEIKNLLDRFFTDMDKQVKDAILHLMNHDHYKAPTVREFKSGLKTDAISILKKEHCDRKAYFYNTLDKVKKEDYQPAINADKIIKQIKTVRNELLRLLLDKPRIQVDFNELIEKDLILLSKEDTKADSAGNLITFAERMPIGIYSDDNLDENNRIDCIIADGIAIQTPHQWQENYPHVKWCCRLTGEIRFMSDKNKNN